MPPGKYPETYFLDDVEVKDRMMRAVARSSGRAYRVAERQGVYRIAAVEYLGVCHDDYGR